MNTHSAFTSKTTGKLNILRHDSYTLSVNGTKQRIFEQTNQVGFGSARSAVD